MNYNSVKEATANTVKEKDMKKENHEIERIRKEGLLLKQKNKLLRQKNNRVRKENLLLNQKNKRVMNDYLLLKQENHRVREESLRLKKENERNFTNSEHSSDIAKNERKRRILSDLEIRRLLNILNLIDPLLAYKWYQIFKSESNIEIIESKIKDLDIFIHKQLIPEFKNVFNYFNFIGLNIVKVTLPANFTGAKN
ncbi:10808_t:CDS:1 [Dentiscutata heterogama]|uniref:10808_t:CDS:1 n=1 Tax=Dentiscutata heterogama TaxID=1316150 RepID=A0ACA9K3E0_9GLOM|nr:10808_t:CDS:1 [Dentiscutata heterogama]